MEAEEEMQSMQVSGGAAASLPETRVQSDLKLAREDMQHRFARISPGLEGDFV